MTKSLEFDASSPNGRGYLSQPLVKDIYTADPSAHVFEGKIYVYPSHDIDAGIPDDDLGSQYAMRDYIVLSMDEAWRSGDCPSSGAESGGCAVG